MSLDRRKFLKAAGGSVAFASLSGCLGIFNVETVESLPHPTRGESDAPTKLEVFEDYRCPHCKTYNEVVVPNLSEHINNGDLYYIHYDRPLSGTGDLSKPAANAARAAQDEVGLNEFWKVNDLLFAEQGNINDTGDIIDIVSDNSQLSANTISQAVRGRYNPVINDDVDEAESRDIYSTPTLVMNGEEVTLSNSWETVLDEIVSRINGNS